jgi:hypothetical protein
MMQDLETVRDTVRDYEEASPARERCGFYRVLSETPRVSVNTSGRQPVGGHDAEWRR